MSSAADHLSINFCGSLFLPTDTIESDLCVFLVWFGPFFIRTDLRLLPHVVSLAETSSSFRVTNISFSIEKTFKWSVRVLKRLKDFKMDLLWPYIICYRRAELFAFQTSDNPDKRNQLLRN